MTFEENFDPFAHDDAAYVLGALDPLEHAAFESHLAGCDACRDRVAQARATVELLGSPSDLAELDDVPALPDTLLPSLLRSARRAQRSRRMAVTVLAGVAAACLIALLVVVWPGRAGTGSGTGPNGAPRAQAMTAVQASNVTATAALQPQLWGTEIHVRCTYAPSSDYARWTYGLRVVDRNGRAHSVGSWQIWPGKTIDFVAGTDLTRADIAAVQVTTASGTPVLQLKQ